MDPMTALSTIPGIGPVLPYVLAAVALAAAVARFLPPPADPKTVYGFVYAVVNAIGQNGGHAANATAPPPETKP